MGPQCLSLELEGEALGVGDIRVNLFENRYASE